MGGVWAHEDVSHDNVVEAFWGIDGLDSEDALWAAVATDLEHVVVVGQHILVVVELEGDVWEALDALAPLVDSNAIDEWVNDGLWSGDEGSSRVDDTHNVVNGDILVSLLETSKVEGPVSLLLNGVGLDLLEFGVLIDTWDHHVGLVRVVVEVEGEGVVGEVTVLNEYWELVHGDSWVGESEDTVELGDEEHGSRGLLDLAKSHEFSGGVTHGNSVLSSSSGDTARSILNGEVLSVFLVSGGFLWVESVVSEASNGVAAVGVHPEVGGSSIRDNGELLGWSSYLNSDEVLGVHVVLDWEASSKDLLSVVLVEHSLGLDVSSRELSLVEWDFASVDGGNKGGGEFEHLFCRSK